MIFYLLKLITNKNNKNNTKNIKLKWIKNNDYLYGLNRHGIFWLLFHLIILMSFELFSLL